jgi:hypothetical protein
VVETVLPATTTADTVVVTETDAVGVLDAGEAATAPIGADPTVPPWPVTATTSTEPSGCTRSERISA